MLSPPSSQGGCNMATRQAERGENMKIRDFVLLLSLLASVALVTRSAMAQDPLCPEPLLRTITCQAGSCRGSVATYVSSLPYQELLVEGDYGQTRICCGAQIPVDSLYYCPGPQPAKFERGELEELARARGYSRVLVPLCRGGYESLRRLRANSAAGSNDL